jgi:hypothetical protein
MDSEAVHLRSRRTKRTCALLGPIQAFFLCSRRMGQNALRCHGASNRVGVLRLRGTIRFATGATTLRMTSGELQSLHFHSSAVDCHSDHGIDLHALQLCDFVRTRDASGNDELVRGCLP